MLCKRFPTHSWLHSSAESPTSPASHRVSRRADRHQADLACAQSRCYQQLAASDPRPQIQNGDLSSLHVLQPSSPLQPVSASEGLLSLGGVALLTAAAATAAALCPDPALAWQIRQEPSNALSLPTWAIHVSSVYEWGLAMALMWKYADVTGNPRWKGMTWGMVPLLGGAFAACTFHFFYNSEDVGFLVPLQAFLTFAGNTTLAIAAYRIYAAAEKPAEP